MTLLLLLPIQRLEQHLVLLLPPGHGEEGLAIDVCQPDSLSKEVACLLLLDLVIALQHKFVLEVEAEDSPQAIPTFSHPNRNVA